MSFTSSANYTQTLTQDASGSLVLQGSGSTGRTDLFTVNGNNGTLFSVSDDLSNSLFSVNTIAGLPVIEAFANNTVTLGQYGQNVLVVTGSSVSIGSADNAGAKLRVNGTSLFDGEQSIYYTNATQTMVGSSGYSLLRMYGNNNGVEVQLDAHASNSTAGTVGTFSNSDFFIKSNNTNRITVKAGGDVGIGTTNPSQKLHIIGTGFASSDFRAPVFYDSANTNYFLDPASTSDSLKIAGQITTALSTGTMISHGAMNDAFGYNSSYGTYIGSPVGGTYYLYANGNFYDNGTVRTLIHSGNIGSQNVNYALSAGNADTLDTYHETAFVRLASNSSTPTNGTFAIGTSGGRNFIQSHSGQPLDINPLGNTVTLNSYVGIGTTSPGYWLDVVGEGRFGSGAKAIIGTDGTYAGYSGIGFGGNTNGYNRIFGHQGTSDDLYLSSATGRGIAFWTNGTSSTRMYITAGGNVGIDTTSPSSKLDVNGYITTSDGNLELYKSYTVDMSNTGTYSTSNYYPVIIPISTEPVLIQVQNNLNSNVPSWATHPAGFTLNVRWITNGSGWGTTQVKRKVQQYFENWASTTICGGITQMTQSSTEVIWLRGGGTYFFKLSRSFTPSPQSSTYTSNGQSVSPTSTAQNTVWNAASGTENYYAGGIYAEMFYDANDNGYYLDPANISNLYTSYFGGVVGIGTTSVSSYPYGGKLNVNGNISTSGGKIGFGVTDAFTLNGIDTAHYGMSSNLNLVQLSGYYGLVFASTGVERMRITDGGNVGIGTTNPSARLHTLINDNSFSPNIYIENTNTGTSALASIILKNASQNVASIYQQNANGDLGIYNSATTGNLNFFTNASNRMTINSSGNVGVGTSNPGYKLEVVGTTAVSNDLTMYGGSGYYLRLNGGTGALGYDSGNNQILSYTPADYTMWMGATKNLVSATIKGGITELLPQSQIESDYVSAISAQGSIITRAVAGASVVTSQLVTLNSSNQWILADADSSTTSTRLLGVALNTAGANEFLAVLLEGTYSTQTYHDQLNSPASPGAPIYISTTAGNVTQTAPTGTGKVVRLVGHNLYGTTGRAAAAVIRFKPDATWIQL